MTDPRPLTTQRKVTVFEAARAHTTRTLSASIPHWLVVPLSRLKHFRRVRVAKRKSRSLVDSLFPDATTCQVLATTGDVAVLRIDREQNDPVILKIAQTTTASDQLAYEADALVELEQLTTAVDPDFVIASLADQGTHAEGAWFTQTLVPGIASAPQTLDHNQILSIAADNISQVHDATTKTWTGEEVQDELIASPLEIVRTHRPCLTKELALIHDYLSASLEPLDLSLSKLHGDFGPSNILWDRDHAAIAGIVDWSFYPQRLPAEIDLVHLALSLISERRKSEYGDAVIGLLTDDLDKIDVDLVCCALDRGPNDLALKPAVALTWLHHIAFGLNKQDQLRSNNLWLHRNVDAVAAALVATILGRSGDIE